VLPSYGLPCCEPSYGHVVGLSRGDFSTPAFASQRCAKSSLKPREPAAKCYLADAVWLTVVLRAVTLAKSVGSGRGATQAACDACMPQASCGLGRWTKRSLLACIAPCAFQVAIAPRTSRLVVAAKLDPDAPTESTCDCALIGDLFQLAPELAACYRVGRLLHDLRLGLPFICRGHLDTVS
jgi:hypothetical protein